MAGFPTDGMELEMKQSLPFPGPQRSTPAEEKDGREGNGALFASSEAPVPGSNETYAQQYSEGVASGRSGNERDSNPYLSQTHDSSDRAESAEKWRSKYDVWRQGWTEGNLIYKRDGPGKPTA